MPALTSVVRWPPLRGSSASFDRRRSVVSAAAVVAWRRCGLRSRSVYSLDGTAAAAAAAADAAESQVA